MTLTDPASTNRSSRPATVVARVLSYNVGNGLAPADRLVQYLYYAEADIIGLQELAGDQAEAIERQLATVYPYRVLFPAGFAGKGLLSRFPIVASERHLFADGRPDLSAQIEIGGRIAQVVVAHPRPPKVRVSGATFDPVTLRQIQEVAKLATCGGPSLVLGDFNMTDRQPEHRIMTTAGLIDAFHEVGLIGQQLSQARRAIRIASVRAPRTSLCRPSFGSTTSGTPATSSRAARDLGAMPDRIIFPSLPASTGATRLLKPITRNPSKSQRSALDP